MYYEELVVVDWRNFSAT